MSLALLGDYRRATGLLTDLLSRFPGCADLWADRGHIYEFRAACEYCDRRATRVQRDRLYTRAARDYRMALRVQPNHVRALVGLGDVEGWQPKFGIKRGQAGPPVADDDDAEE